MRLSTTCFVRSEQTVLCAMMCDRYRATCRRLSTDPIDLMCVPAQMRRTPTAQIHEYQSAHYNWRLHARRSTAIPSTGEQIRHRDGNDVGTTGLMVLRYEYVVVRKPFSRKREHPVFALLRRKSRRKRGRVRRTDLAQETFP